MSCTTAVRWTACGQRLVEADGSPGPRDCRASARGRRYSAAVSGGSDQEAKSGARSDAPSLCVFMPALDEAEGVIRALSAVDDELASLQALRVLSRYEVVLVDDGSTDRTAERAIDVSRCRPSVRIVRHDHNRGVGAALRTGLSYATTELLLYTDADMPVDLAEIEPALALMGPSAVDLVVGYRKGFDGEPWTRRAASGLYDVLARRLFGVRERDVNFPFKMLRVDRCPSVGAPLRRSLRGRRTARQGEAARAPGRGARDDLPHEERR